MALRAALTFTAAMAVAGFTQVTPPRDTRPAPVTGTAMIRGRIIAADTRQPLSRARITISGPGLDGTRTTATNRDGRYEIRNLPAGRFTLTVNRSGYLTLGFGQRRPLEQAKQLEVLENQRLDNVDWLLPRISVISGRITDENGEPVSGVAVRAARFGYQNGRKQLVLASNGVTDDEGLYRLSDLGPGTYVMLATFRDTWTVTDVAGDHLMTYAPTYFPGTQDVATARRVNVGIGQEVRGTDFSLIAGRTATVSGTAHDSRGRPLSGVVLVQQSLGAIGFVGNPTTRLTIRPDGTFSIASVPPGEYQLVGVGSGAQAVVPVNVNGFDVDGVTVVASPPWSMSGRIRTEDQMPPPFAPNQMSLTAAPDELLTIAIAGANGPRPNQAVNADWTFSISDVTGSGRLRPRLPEGWMLKAAMRDGVDVSDASLNPPGGTALDNVQLVLTNRLVRLSGRVTDDAGRPLADGTVILFPGDPQKWYANSRWIRAVRPDQNGAYQINGLLPGEYLAVAVDYVELNQWHDPEYLESLRRFARAMSLGAAQSVSDLALVLVAP